MFYMVFLALLDWLLTVGGLCFIYGIPQTVCTTYTYITYIYYECLYYMYVASHMPIYIYNISHMYINEMNINIRIRIEL